MSEYTKGEQSDTHHSVPLPKLGIIGLHYWIGLSTMNISNFSISSS